MPLAFLGKPVEAFYSRLPRESGAAVQPVESVAYVFGGRILAEPHRNTKNYNRFAGDIVKGLHAVNGALFLLNAVLWAFLAKQPGIAALCLAVGLGELYVITKTELLSN